MSPSPPPVLPRPRRVAGVDFSGAINAGKKTWIAEGIVHGPTLSVTNVRPVGELPGSRKDREGCTRALLEIMAAGSFTVFGFDFPFGLPRALVRARSWEEFALSFGTLYADPVGFRASCWTAAGGAELRRVTDCEARTPFSPYNRRCCYQTFYGIRDVLAPVIRGNVARILPMQQPTSEQPWIVEVCPASTLKRACLYMPYKGRTQDHGRAREIILGKLEASGSLSIPEPRVRQTVLKDANGDALDSVIASLAVFHTVCDPRCPIRPCSGDCELEGYVFV